MTRLLIPTDFSSTARHAIRYAQYLWRDTELEILLFHACRCSAPQLDFPAKHLEEDQAEALCEEAETKLQELIQDVQLESQDKHQFTTIISKELLTTGLEQTIESHKPNLLVMGTRGKNSPYRSIFGSYTSQMFKMLNIPVLAVPDEYHLRPIHRALLPTNFQLPFKSSEVGGIQLLARGLNRVECLYISDFTHMTKIQNTHLERFQEELGIPVSVRQSGVGNKKEVIASQLSEEAFDLLVMVNTHHSYFEELLYQSTLDQLALELPVPMLVLQH